MQKQLSDCTILVVDDTETNIDILVDALGDEYELAVAMDGPTALELVEELPPDLILLDIMMPGMSGYEVITHLKANPKSASIPVIFLTAMSDVGNKTKGFELGAVDYITKPFEVAEVQARVDTHLSLSLIRNELEQHNEILEEKVRERTRELSHMQDVTIQSMAVVAEYRDPETGGHIHRTQNYIRALAEQLHKEGKHRGYLDRDSIELLYKSAPLHDIGKVGVPDTVLLKPGKLNDEEWRIMKTHPIIGRDAIAASEESLGSNSFLTLAKEISYSHHEKWDGSGYPEGLLGEEIPLSARMMALSDVYDALISKRVYKPPFSHEKATNIILESRGTHFDPEVVDAFATIQEEFHAIAKQFKDDDEDIPQS